MEKKRTNILQKMLGGFLSVLLILTMYSPSVHATTSLYYGDWWYESNGCIISYNGTAANVVIPEKIGKVKITKLFRSVFAQNATLKSVTIPSTITEIPQDAFGLCPALTTVNLPKTIKKIDDVAFESCGALKNIILPDGLQSIGEGAFAGCTSLTQVNLTNKLTYLGVSAFSTTGITSLTLPDNFTTIPAGLLYDTQITTFTIPSKVKEIEAKAFAKCSKLTKLVVPSRITTIGPDAFIESPLLTVYGSNGSIAQAECMMEVVPFVDTDDTVAQVVLPDPIVMPAAKAAPTVTATPSKIKVAYQNQVKKVEAYTINGEDYYRATDLDCVMMGACEEFSPSFDDEKNAINLKIGRMSDIIPKPIISKNYGKNAAATRVYPTIYKGHTDVSGMIRVYSINGELFCEFQDIMDVINCGAFLNKKTGVVNLDPRCGFEPFNSPVFAPVPKGDAAYMRVQKKLYDAYMNRTDGPPAENLTVPDNATFYIPRGIEYDHLEDGKIHLGNNSKFVVKGSWGPEYPGKCLLSKPGNKNAVYVNDAQTVQIHPSRGTNNTIEFAGGDTHQYPDYTKFTSTNISYDSVVDGVQHIIFSCTRDKLDPDRYVYVYFNVVGGQSYGCMYNNVKYSVDLTQQLTKVAALNVGKKAVINKIMVRNTNGLMDAPFVTIPVNWTIATSGTAPTIQSTVDYYQPDAGDVDYGGMLKFKGLTKNSYIVKYTSSKMSDKQLQYYGDTSLHLGDNYTAISPSTNYMFETISPDNEEAWFGEYVMGTAASVAQFTGVKTSGGKDSYAFVISPFSNSANFTFPDPGYPVSGSLTFDKEKTYLNFGLNKYDAPAYGGTADVMVKYHKKGDPADVLNLLYSENVFVDKTQLTGKIDLTLPLTDLANKKGVVAIDSIAIFTYETRIVDDWNFPSANFFAVPCDFTTTVIDSAKLGADTVVRTPLPTVAVQAPPANTVINVKLSLKNTSLSFIQQVKISPAGKNQWSENLLGEEETIWPEGSIDIDFAYKREAPKFDIEVADDVSKKFLVCRNVDLTGITAQYGANIILKTDDDFTKLTTEVQNNLPFKPIQKGDFGTDTIDVKLIAGSTVNTFDVKDFSIVYDDGLSTPFPQTAVKILSLSQTTAGDAKMTIAKYFDDSDLEREYHAKPILIYKGYKVGIIEVTNR